MKSVQNVHEKHRKSTAFHDERPLARNCNPMFGLFFALFVACFWLASVFLGRDPDPKMLDEMLNEAPGPLNFTMFLTLFGEKTKGR